MKEQKKHKNTIEKRVIGSQTQWPFWHQSEKTGSLRRGEELKRQVSKRLCTAPRKTKGERRNEASGQKKQPHRGALNRKEPSTGFLATRERIEDTYEKGGGSTPSYMHTSWQNPASKENRGTRNLDERLQPGTAPQRRETGGRRDFVGKKKNNRKFQSEPQSSAEQRDEVRFHSGNWAKSRPRSSHRQAKIAYYLTRRGSTKFFSKAEGGGRAKKKIISGFQKAGEKGIVKSEGDTKPRSYIKM